MSVDLDRQLQAYCRLIDEKQGSLSFDDILERTGELQIIPGRGTKQISPRRKWIAITATALGFFLVVVGIRFLAATGGLEPADQPTTTFAPPRTDFPESGPIEAGTYYIEPSESSVAGVTLTMPDGWTTQDGLSTVIKESDQDGEVFFSFITVDAISSEPCLRRDGMAVGRSVDDLAQALLALPHTSAIGPVDTTLGGQPAKRVDMTIAEDFETAGCNVPGLQIWYSEPADNHFVLLDGGTASVYIFDVDGERQIFVTHYRAGTRAEDMAEIQAIVDSITIDAATTPTFAPETKVEPLQQP